MAEDREVAGIRCTAVLERLSEYLDEELAPDVRHTIDAHLAGCDWCAKFGGRFTGLVEKARAKLRVEEPLDRDVAERLARRLAALSTE